MKYLLSIDEMHKYEGDPSSSTPWREQWLDPSEKRFSCLVPAGSYSLLVKRDAPNELWVFKNYVTHNFPEFRKHLLRKEWTNFEGEKNWDYKFEDAIAMEDFVTRIYRGDFDGKESEFSNPETTTSSLRRLFSKNVVCKDPNQAIKEWPYGDALLIRISGAMAQKMKEYFKEQIEEESSGGIIYESYRRILNYLEKVYPEGKLIPGEKPEEPTKQDT